MAYGKTEYILNLTGKGSRNDVIYRQIRDLDKVLNPIPDALKINDLTVSIDKDQLALLEPGTEYEVSGPEGGLAHFCHFTKRNAADRLRSAGDKRKHPSNCIL